VILPPFLGSESQLTGDIASLTTGIKINKKQTKSGRGHSQL
jgi:hypothetical protein